MSLPPGLIIVNSIEYSPELEPEIKVGCCILRNSTSSEFWATDFRCSINDDPMQNNAVFGPRTSLFDARSELDGVIVAEMDAHGTPGSSTWLVYP